MANELEKMRDIRINQKNIRLSLSRREEKNKSLRAQITPIWDDASESDKVKALSKELFKGREKVRSYQYLLKEFKLGLREANRHYDLSKNS